MSSQNFAAADVDARIAKASDFTRPICVKLREIIHLAAPDLEECIKWGMPAYKGNGLVCCIGAFKEHVTLHFFRGAELNDGGGLLVPDDKSANSRKVKFTSLAELKPGPLATLIKQAVKMDATEKPVQVKAKRAEFPVPPALTVALKKNAKAKKYFESLPPSCRREYSEWIRTAKQEETVQRRLGKAMTMFTEGRRMNDQYR